MNASEASAAAHSSSPRQRFSLWALLLLFSTLALTAHTTDDLAPTPKNVKALITATTSVTLALSLVAVLAHVGNSALGSLFVGTMVEGLTSLLLVALWAGCLPVVMDPDKGLGQMYVGRSGSSVADYQSTISNANLYFTAWGCAITLLSILAMYVRDRIGASSTGMGYTANWYLLLLASVMVIIESMRFKNQVCSIEGGTSDTTCHRNTYGLITGIVGLVLSFLISLFSSLGKDSAMITTASSFLMAILYTVCAGLLTFQNGPATYVGNHYFAAWAGFFMSFVILGGVMKEFLGINKSAVPGAAAASANGESDVEMDRI